MSKREGILRIAKEISNSTGAYPTPAQLAARGISRDTIRRAYGNYSSLYDSVAESNVLFDLERSEYSKKIPRGAKRFVVTTAVTGAEVDTRALASIRKYCQTNNAKLLVLVSMSKPNNLILDPKLRNEIIVTEDSALNNKISILGIKNGAKRADPITGLPRIGQRNGSIVCPSPKQRLKFVATGTDSLPHALMSTGAITRPNYLSSRNLVDQAAYVANEDHLMGALIVELQDDNFYHFRQVQFDHRGSFTDLGMQYGGSTVSKVRGATLVLGDWHSGETDPVVVKALTNLSDKLNVSTWVIHDAFNGLSINHHLDNKAITRAKLDADNLLSLRAELNGLVKDLDSMADKRNVLIVKSNHDEWIDGYLQGGKYVHDPRNHRLALDLAADLIDGLDPIQEYYKRNAKSKKKDNVRWLERDESFKIAGIELGQHGDIGSNGAYGSEVSMEAAYGDCVYGHTHTPNILRGAWCVGTSTYLRVGYNRGASSWFQTACLVYPSGQRQLINVVQGRTSTLLG